MIPEYLGVVWAVESMRHSGQLFIHVLGYRIHASPVTVVR
jgi:hypothetical protein